MPGVVSTSVGYTGGTTKSPTYETVCRGDGHTEALKIQFDPSVISYEEVMKKVLPSTSGFKAKPQYMSAVWAQNEEQKKVAQAVAKSFGKEDVPILPAQHWQDAEEYHRRRPPPMPSNHRRKDEGLQHATLSHFSSLLKSDALSSRLAQSTTSINSVAVGEEVPHAAGPSRYDLDAQVIGLVWGLVAAGNTALRVA